MWQLVIKDTYSQQSKKKNVLTISLSIIESAIELLKGEYYTYYHLKK